jgi:hypothetical protein
VDHKESRTESADRRDAIRDSRIATDGQARNGVSTTKKLLRFKVEIRK